MLGSRGGRGLCRGGLITDLVLLVIFLTLVFVFIQRRGYMNKINHGAESLRNSGDSSQGHQLRRFEVDERIRKIPDTRSIQCRVHSYRVDLKVSIIITFTDYQFYDLKTTVASVIHNTAPNLIEEIIVVDDGSTLDYIKEDSKSFAQSVPIVKLIRVENKVGVANARTRGVKEAKTQYLVFLDSSVVCNEGWLPPLTESMRKERSTVAVPHYDSINDPVSYEYSVTHAELLTTFSWSLTMRMSPSHVTKTDLVDSSIKSPVTRGTAFAVRRRFFEDIGGFDLSMNAAGAESLEFSIRVWLCGGEIKVLPCSRVGVLNLKDPVKVVLPENVRRIVQLWIPTKKDFLFKYTGVNADMTREERKSLARREDQLKQLECKHFDWYLQNVIPDIYTPSSDAIAYGLLRCRSGRCGRIGDDRRVDLGQCKPDQYKIHSSKMIFEQNKAGNIKTTGKCLTVHPSAYITLEDCKAGDNTQQWELKPNGVLRNLWSNYCAMHVTDPDKNVEKGRQIMMVQECRPDASGMFIEFEFILP